MLTKGKGEHRQAQMVNTVEAKEEPPLATYVPAAKYDPSLPSSGRWDGSKDRGRVPHKFVGVIVSLFGRGSGSALKSRETLSVSCF